MSIIMKLLGRELYDDPEPLPAGVGPPTPTREKNPMSENDPQVVSEIDKESSAIKTTVLAIDDLPLHSRRATVAYLCERWCAEGLLRLYQTQSQAGANVRRPTTTWEDDD